MRKGSKFMLHQPISVVVKISTHKIFYRSSQSFSIQNAHAYPHKKGRKKTKEGLFLV